MFEFNEIPQDVINTVVANPGYFHVDADGKNIYTFEPNSRMMLQITGEGFDKMNAEEINALIIDTMKDYISKHN